MLTSVAWRGCPRTGEFSRRCAQTRGNLLDPRRSQEKRAQAENESVTREEVWRALPRTAENQQLLEEEILSDHSPRAAGPEALGGSGQKVDDKNQYLLHSREFQGNGGAGRKIVNWPDFSTDWQFETHSHRQAERWWFA